MNDLGALRPPYAASRETPWQKGDAMRFEFRCLAALAVVLAVVGLIFADLHGSAVLGNEIDASSAVRGSLGISFDDLTPEEAFRSWCFILNGGCVLLFGGAAFIIGRRKKRRDHAGKSALPPTSLELYKQVQHSIDTRPP
jgi:hypothetical protein